MRSLWAGLLCFAAGSTAIAEDWKPVEGAEIRRLLDGKRLEYARAWQEFDASGRTTYHVGTESYGFWRVQGDFYCSQWPPSDLWACYGLERAGNKLRFVDAGGEITEAVYAK